MNTVLDDALVGLVIAMGFGYAVYTLGPRSLRKRMALGAAALLNRLPPFMGMRGAARRLAAAGAKSQGSCGGCDSCGAEKPALPVAGEVRIPLSRIGRRD